MRKGISPLIASVLLIAFVISVAALFMNWYTPFQRSELKTTKEMSEENIQCRFASMSVHSASFNCSGFPGRLRFLLENTQNEVLEGFSAQVVYKNKTSFTLKLAPRNVSIDSGEMNFYHNDSLPSISPVDRIYVVEEECPINTRDWVDREDIEYCS